MKQFTRRFEASLRDRNVLPCGEKILIAVSGGPDSVALLALLETLSEKYTWSLRVAHINYHLRGRDSLADENLVRTLAKKWHLPISVLSSHNKPKKNTEEHLRIIRYDFLERVRKKYRFNSIATAHTQNDVAETILLNLLRGAGPTGLTPFTRMHSSLVRPLLPFSRQEVERYLHARGIPFRLDRSNIDPRFTRNRVRHKLLPLLEKEFNPNIVATLARSAELLATTSKNAPSHLLVTKLSPRTYSFARPAFLALPATKQVTALSDFFRLLLGTSPSQAFLNEVIKALRSTKSKTQLVENRRLSIRIFSAKVETTLKPI